MVAYGGAHCQEYVDKGEDWLAEPSLWTENWLGARGKAIGPLGDCRRFLRRLVWHDVARYHVGEAKAHTDCEVLLIDPQAEPLLGTGSTT